MLLPIDDTPLTPAQQQYLQLVEAFKNKFGKAPMMEASADPETYSETLREALKTGNPGGLIHPQGVIVD